VTSHVVSRVSEAQNSPIYVVN